MSSEACCTCADLLIVTPPSYSLNTEKPLPQDPPHRLACCNRAVCAACISKNPRFSSYCPYCQVSTEPSSLPQGLRDPPAYSSAPNSPSRGPADRKNTTGEAAQSGLEEPPAYCSLDEKYRAPPGNNGGAITPDVTHHLHPTDTISSLSLAYGVPASVLRQHNSLFSDHLISARHVISVPGSHYQGPSLSDKPVESEEETERKSKVRRFMVAAKCHDYEVAELYLRQADGDLDEALIRWRDDEKWEAENPFRKDGGGKKGARIARGFGGGLTGQLS